MATVISDETTISADGSETRTVVYSDGGQSITFTPGPGTPGANLAALQDKALAAFEANAAYLALNNPNAAANTAQVKLLTREWNALAKLVLGLLDDVTGT